MGREFIAEGAPAVVPPMPSVSEIAGEYLWGRQPHRGKEFSEHRLVVENIGIVPVQPVQMLFPFAIGHDAVEVAAYLAIPIGLLRIETGQDVLDPLQRCQLPVVGRGTVGPVATGVAFQEAKAALVDRLVNQTLQHQAWVPFLGCSPGNLSKSPKRSSHS